MNCKNWNQTNIIGYRLSFELRVHPSIPPISLFFARPVAIDEYFYSFSIFGQARRTMIYSFGYGIGYAENKSVVMLQVSNGFCHNW